MKSEIIQTYGHKVRARVCGLCWKDNSLLMVNHGLYHVDFWSPPGGGIEFGESAETCLKREFQEEVGIEIKVLSYGFICELIKSPLHAIELFFHVEYVQGQVKTGYDLETKEQIIKDARYLNEAALMQIPEEQKHGIFKYCSSLQDLKAIQGYFAV